MPVGQSYVESAGADKGYITTPVTNKNIFEQSRLGSFIGQLANEGKPFAGFPHGYNNNDKPNINSCVAQQEITSGDEARFTMEQPIVGAPTWGDNPLASGDYLAYLHATLFLNMTRAPKVPIVGEMSAQRWKDVITDQSSSIRKSLTRYMAEQYVTDFLDAFWLGASRNLLDTKVNGGRAIDLGRGAGIQTSPENMIVFGSGKVSPTFSSTLTTTLDNHETALNTAIDGLSTASASDLITLQSLNDIREAITEWKIEGVNVNGVEKWYLLLDPVLLSSLTEVNSALGNAWITGYPRSEKNPFFGYRGIEYRDLLIVAEPWLARYCPDSSGSEIVWGSSNADKRELELGTGGTSDQKSKRLGMVLGKMAMLEGHNGAVEPTFDAGSHGQGATYSAKVKQSLMRARWLPKDGRGLAPLNQGSIGIVWADKGATYGT